MSRREFTDSVVVVTGAASGIGRATAIAFAARGARLAISDVDEDGLAETRGHIEDLGREVHTARVDVADRDAVNAWADEVIAHFGTVNVVVNNAGVAMVAPIKHMSYEDLRWLMDINFWGVVHGTMAFLPHLEDAAWGHVVNISSVFGIIAVPGQAAYNAAKFAVRGYTECLRQELEREGSSVSATSVHPGGIRTEIARNARIGAPTEVVGEKASLARRFDKMAKTSPEDAARVIVRAVEKDQPRLLIGADAYVIDQIQRWLPTSYRALTKKLA